MNSAELAASSHVVVVNRWREHYADYARYIDHRAHRVTYVSTEVGRSSIPEGATEVAVVEATDDLAEVRKAVDALAQRHGAPDRIVALKEDDLLTGAALRAEWGVPGPREEQLLPFRDKFLMATRVAASGVDVPSFAPAPDGRAVLDFAAGSGWPVIVKPLIGSSSAGVVRLDGPDDLAGVSFAGEPRMVQAFNPHPIFHVDGSFDGRELTVVRASRYLNNCLEFRGGGVLGSVEESDPETNAAVAAFAVRVLRALTDRPTVFHLEVFLDPATRTCSFLEVGARVGGAEIPLLWREVHGRDLMATAFRNQLGLPPVPEAQDQSPGSGGETAGWLLVPAPESRPCRITEVTPMVGRQPGPYAEALLTPGEVLPEADSYYEHVGGRFRFRGPSTSAVEEAIRLTAAAFRVSAEPAVSP
ncbi:acetyl-CoA carboxylase biotin carboxylase subunit family protein [Streptomyces sp. ISL-86]|uniref:ATP-grasp domain-containing protein n=1 Tax=Streptomyces sp. ISL-86 TaxID=2819187 RepID=UPI001BED2F9B|nr:biotin carboxylase [Streptomyces sp. ISL-86]MBT2458740.1 biotin carboxylase [Streptomyces sp. ISL-86]